MVYIANLKEATNWFMRKMVDNQLEQVGGVSIQSHIQNEKGVYGHVVSVISKSVFGFDVPTRYYVVHKRAHFNNYGKEFPAEKEKVGETVTYDAVEDAANDNAVIAIVMEFGDIFLCPAKDWLKYATENKTIRETTVSKNNEGYLEASVPLSMLKKIP